METQFIYCGHGGKRAQSARRSRRPVTTEVREIHTLYHTVSYAVSLAHAASTLSATATISRRPELIRLIVGAVNGSASQHAHGRMERALLSTMEENSDTFLGSESRKARCCRVKTEPNRRHCTGKSWRPVVLPLSKTKETQGCEWTHAVSNH